jgi:hypothetical protein
MLGSVKAPIVELIVDKAKWIDVGISFGLVFGFALHKVVEEKVAKFNRLSADFFFGRFL